MVNSGNQILLMNVENVDGVEQLKLEKKMVGCQCHGKTVANRDFWTDHFCHYIREVYA